MFVRADRNVVRKRGTALSRQSAEQVIVDVKVNLSKTAGVYVASGGRFQQHNINPKTMVGTQQESDERDESTDSSNSEIDLTWRIDKLFNQVET